MSLSQTWEDYVKWSALAENKVQAREVSIQMKRWQKPWTQLCGRQCCYASHCASHRCDSCGESITRVVPPLDRFVCVSCLFEGESDKDGNAKAFQVCSKCFSNPAALHNHTEFVRVQGTNGIHAGVERKEGLAKSFNYRESDFVSVMSVGGECYCCMTEFSPETPAMAALGCQGESKHGAPEGFFNGDGIKDSKQYACLPCSMLTLEHSSRTTYCAQTEGQIPLSCSVCVFDAEKASWKQQFEQIACLLEKIMAEEAKNEVQLLARLNSSIEMNPLCSEDLDSPLTRNILINAVKQSLKSLHPQAWLHTLIDATVR